MKKIIKKVVASALVFGLLVIPVRPAAAFGFNDTATTVKRMTPLLTNVFTWFGYDNATEIINGWTPVIVEFLKGFGMISDLFNKNSANSVNEDAF